MAGELECARSDTLYAPDDAGREVAIAHCGRDAPCSCDTVPSGLQRALHTWSAPSTAAGVMSGGSGTTDGLNCSGAGGARAAVAAPVAACRRWHLQTPAAQVLPCSGAWDSPIERGSCSSMNTTAGTVEQFGRTVGPVRSCI